jgi:hypothetical protein
MVIIRGFQVAKFPVSTAAGYRLPMLDGGEDRALLLPHGEGINKKPAEGSHVEPQQCEVCGSPANVQASGAYIYEDCSRCGDFQIDREVAEDFLPRLKEYQRPLASHLIHRLQGKKRPILLSDFFNSLSGRTLPTPTEMMINVGVVKVTLDTIR